MQNAASTFGDDYKSAWIERARGQICCSTQLRQTRTTSQND